MWLSILAFLQLSFAIGSIRSLGSVWYMHLKVENCSLKTCVEIRVIEKVCRNTCNVV